MGLLLMGCRAGKESQISAQSENQPQIIVAEMGEQTVVPDATVFRMSGDYAGNVAVTLNADGSLQYYPAPSDITPESAPYDLGNGWWLNRQGLSGNSVFTKWTFAEYAALPVVPTHEEIKAAVIPGARVTSFYRVPVSQSDAIADPSLCLPYLP